MALTRGSPGERSKPNLLLHDFPVSVFFFSLFLLNFLLLLSHNERLDSFFVPIQARDQTGQTSAAVLFLTFNNFSRWKGG